MNKSIECEYRRPASEVSDAVKRQGVPAGVRGCDRPGDNNIDRVCGFLEITDSSKCPQTLFDKGEISIDELIERKWGK